jgi:hypothetical protein
MKKNTTQTKAKPRSRTQELQKLFPSLEEFTRVANMFNLASKFGYANAKLAWYANPQVVTGAHYSDYKKAE